jgi:hypothetical protein
VAKLLGFLIAAGISVSAQTVEGTVIDAYTGAGIAGAHVELSGPSAYSATTDAQGRFHIDDVKQGWYGWGYTTPDYYIPLGGTYEFRVTGANPVKLEGRMASIPKLSGHIVYARGDPVPKAALELEGRFVVQSEGYTDADGKFNIHHGLPQGGYELAVEPPAGAKPPDPDPDSGAERAWAAPAIPASPRRKRRPKLTFVPAPSCRTWIGNSRRSPFAPFAAFCSTPMAPPRPTSKSLPAARGSPPSTPGRSRTEPSNSAWLTANGPWPPKSGRLRVRAARNFASGSG